MSSSQSSTVITVNCTLYSILHSCSILAPKGSNRRNWRVLGWSDVIMQRGYSLMLPAGIMLHKQYTYVRTQVVIVTICG